MIPVLYPPNAANFSTFGLGVLTDTISCEVTEERNGVFECLLKYPVSGQHYGLITKECIIKAKPNDTAVDQAFRIYRITKPLNGIVSIYGQHISYDLANVPVLPFSTESRSPQLLLSQLLARDTRFTGWTDYSDAKAFFVTQPKSVRACLGGTEGSMLSKWYGEFEWDNFTVKFHSHRGQKTGVVIEYGKNLTSLEQDEDNSGVYTALLPYAVYTPEGSDTETVETVSNDQGVLEERVLNSESRVSELEHTVDGLSVTMQEQYIGGINYVQNSSGLNGITDDWSYSGTVKTDTSTDTQNNTVSDSCFVLGAYSSLSQYIRGVVPGTYTISVRAKKTSAMSGYFYVTYNGNKTAYLFNKSTSFDWTDFTVTLTDVTDPTLRIYCYCRDASIYLADIMISEGAIPRKWTPAPNEIYTQEVKIDKRGIEVSNSASSQRTVITNTEFAGYYNDEVIFTLNKDETQTKKTTVDGELTVGKTKFVPMPTASEGLNIVILD